MYWILKIYLFFDIFCFACSMNSCHILSRLAKDMGYCFEKTGAGSIFTLILVSVCPLYHIFAAFVWLFTSTETYKEKVYEYATPIE